MSSSPLFRTITRRKLAKTAAIGGVAVAAAGTAAGCSVIGSTGVNPAVIDAVNSVLATGCTVIATAETIASVIGASFPAAQGVASIASDVASQIAAFICNGVKQSAKDERGKFTAQPKAGGVDIHGWHIVNGQIVSF